MKKFETIHPRDAKEIMDDLDKMGIIYVYDKESVGNCAVISITIDNKDCEKLPYEIKRFFE